MWHFNGWVGSAEALEFCLSLCYMETDGLAAKSGIEGRWLCSNYLVDDQIKPGILQLLSKHFKQNHKTGGKKDTTTTTTTGLNNYEPPKEDAD